MTEFCYSTEFAATPETIWPYLEDSDKIVQWMTGVVADRATSDPPTRVGSTFEIDIKEGRKVVTYQGEVTKYEQHRLMGVKMIGGCRGPMTMYADYLLTDLGDGRTRLDYTGRADLPTGLLYKLMAPIGKLMGKMLVKKFMRNLRGLVEQPQVATG